MDSEENLRSRFIEDVAAARGGDLRAGDRARAMAAVRAGRDAAWDRVIGDARDVVGERPPDLPGYEAAVVRGATRLRGGALPWIGLVITGAALLAALAAAAIWD